MGGLLQFFFEFWLSEPLRCMYGSCYPSKPHRRVVKTWTPTLKTQNSLRQRFNYHSLREVLLVRWFFTPHLTQYFTRSEKQLTGHFSRKKSAKSRKATKQDESESFKQRNLKSSDRRREKCFTCLSLTASPKLFLEKTFEDCLLSSEVFFWLTLDALKLAHQLPHATNHTAY